MREVLSRSGEVPVRAILLLAVLASFSCAGTAVTDRFVEVDPVTDMDAPDASKRSSGKEQDVEAIRHGRYLVELLGCGSCHTDGALIGEPRFDRRLAGSSVGIAIDNPLDQPFPGVAYPANLTPDDETGLGLWSEAEIAIAIRSGAGRGERLHAVMPWSAYSRISDADVKDIAVYLKSLEPVRHRVPKHVPSGRPARDEFVYFGIYQSN